MNNPVMFVDPSGMVAVPIMTGLIAGGGGLIASAVVAASRPSGSGSSGSGSSGSYAIGAAVIPIPMPMPIPLPVPMPGNPFSTRNNTMDMNRPSPSFNLDLPSNQNPLSYAFFRILMTTAEQAVNRTNASHSNAAPSWTGNSHGQGMAGLPEVALPGAVGQTTINSATIPSVEQRDRAIAAVNIQLMGETFHAVGGPAKAPVILHQITPEQAASLAWTGHNVYTPRQDNAFIFATIVGLGPPNGRLDQSGFQYNPHYHLFWQHYDITSGNQISSGLNAHVFFGNTGR